MVNIRRASIARSRPAGARGFMTGSGIPGRNMTPLGPAPPVLGDGWSQVSANRFLYESSVAVSPTLVFSGAVPGVPYRVVTICRKWTGTGLISVELGTQLFYNITEVGLYDKSFKAPVGGTDLVFTVQTNATVSLADIEIQVIRG